MNITLKLPKLSMNMDEGTVVDWRLGADETFKAGDVIYSVETEKVTSDVEAPCDGVLLEILAKDGDDVEVGGAVCKIRKTG